MLNIIDISHYEKTVDWKAVKASGKVDGVFAKATEGDSFVDPMFLKHRVGAMSVSIPFGAYHFFHASKDPMDQAALFCKTVHGLNPGDIFPMFDWERGSQDGEPPPTDTTNGLLCLNTIKKIFDISTMIDYGGLDFLQSLQGNDRLAAANPLWLAEYGPSLHVPPPWKNWTLWQYSDKGPVPGIGNIDVSYFNGNAEQFKAYLV
jgi:lysozyme